MGSSQLLIGTRGACRNEHPPYVSPPSFLVPSLLPCATCASSSSHRLSFWTQMLFALLNPSLADGRHSGAASRGTSQGGQPASCPRLGSTCQLPAATGVLSITSSRLQEGRDGACLQGAPTPAQEHRGPASPLTPRASLQEASTVCWAALWDTAMTKSPVHAPAELTF